MTRSITHSFFKNWLYKDIQPYWAHRYLAALEGDDLQIKKLAIVGFLARIQVEESSGLTLIGDRTPGDRRSVFEKIHGLFGGEEGFKKKIGGESWTMAILEKKEELWRELEGARRRRIGLVWIGGALAGGIVIGLLLLFLLPKMGPSEQIARAGMNPYALPTYSEKTVGQGAEDSRRKVDPVPMVDKSKPSVSELKVPPLPSTEARKDATIVVVGNGPGVEAKVAPLPEVQVEPVKSVPVATTAGDGNVGLAKVVANDPGVEAKVAPLPEVQVEPVKSVPVATTVGDGNVGLAKVVANDPVVETKVAPLPEVQVEPVKSVPVATTEGDGKIGLVKVVGETKTEGVEGASAGSVATTLKILPAPGEALEKDRPLVTGKNDSSGDVVKPLQVEPLGPLRVEPIKVDVDKLRVDGEVFEGFPGEAPFKPMKVAIVRYWQSPYVAVADSGGGTVVGFSVHAPDTQHVQFSIADIVGRTVSFEGEDFVVSRENFGEMGLFFQLIPREAFLVAFDSHGVATIPQSFWSRLVKANGKWVTVSRILRKSEGGSLYIRDLASQTIEDVQADLVGEGVKK